MSTGKQHSAQAIGYLLLSGKELDTTERFSQRLEKEIKNTGKTLYYLSEASGMQLDYILK